MKALTSVASAGVLSCSALGHKQHHPVRQDHLPHLERGPKSARKRHNIPGHPEWERCGTDHIHQRQNHEDLENLKTLDAIYHEQIQTGRRRLEAFSVTVPTYYHVVYYGLLPSVTMEQVQAQHDTLNDGFRETGIQFELTNVTSTINQEWTLASWGDAADIEMKETLHRGGLESLNVYIVDFVSGTEGTIGIASVPSFFFG